MTHYPGAGRNDSATGRNRRTPDRGMTLGELTAPPCVGPAMLAAVKYVAAHPGCNKLRVAEAVGSFTSRRYGYDTVNRAMRAGLIEHRLGAADFARGSYALYLTPAGWALIEPPRPRTVRP